MTMQDVIKLAKQCGDWNGQTAEFNDVGLARFAALVAEQERQRKPLSDEEISKVAAPFYGVQGFRVEAFARAIEAAHGIKEET
jgi:hypothetical protein